MAPLEIGVFLSVLRMPEVEHALAVAHDLGFRVVQLGSLAERFYTPEGAAALAALLRKNQLEAVALTMAYDGERYTSVDAARRTVGLVPPETRQARLAYSRRCVDAASALGVPLVTAHLGFIPADPADPEYRRILAATDELAAYGAARGVRLGLETGQETAEELLEFMARLETPVGVNFDGANFVAYDVQDPLEALGALLPHLVGVHIKDYTRPASPALLGRPCPLGEGAARVGETIALLRDTGFARPLILETHEGADSIQALTAARQYVGRHWHEPSSPERTGAERFSTRLRRAAGPIWEAQHAHPFVRGIADGTLGLDRFRHWVRQDYAFLIDYARLLALAAARASDLATMARWAELLRATLGTEMALHRASAAELGIGPEDLEGEVAAPTTRGYADFLLRTAALGDYIELVAALLPCMWGFAEVGARLAAGSQPADPRYRAWIATYASPEFQDLAAWCRELLDRLAGQAPPAALAAAERAFVASSRHELAFWRMAWDLEAWPA